MLEYVENAIKGCDRSSVRDEEIGERNLDFSQEVREEGRIVGSAIMRCPESSIGIEIGCYLAHDLDFVLRDHHRNLVMFLEVKTHGREYLRYGEVTLLNLFDTAVFEDYKNLGSHVLVFENTCSNNSKWITFDGELITKQDLWRKLNFLDYVLDDMENFCNRY